MEEHPDYAGKVVGSIPAPPTNLQHVLMMSDPKKRIWLSTARKQAR